MVDDEEEEGLCHRPAGGGRDEVRHHHHLASPTSPLSAGIRCSAPRWRRSADVLEEKEVLCRRPAGRDEVPHHHRLVLLVLSPLVFAVPSRGGGVVSSPSWWKGRSTSSSPSSPTSPISAPRWRRSAYVLEEEEEMCHRPAGRDDVRHHHHLVLVLSPLAFGAGTNK